MKKIFPILMILMIISQTPCLSQVNGWVQNECGLVSNPNYHYESYSSGNHAYGYKLYHFDKVIFQEMYFQVYIYFKELKFIDDTTGFLVTQIMNIDHFQISIHKILNDSVIDIGGGPGYSFNSFILNRHTAYLAIYGLNYNPFDTTSHILFIRCSDLMSQKGLNFNDSLFQDTTTIFHDTVSGIPLCPDINELSYHYLYDSTTEFYTIKFRIDTLDYISQINEPSYSVFPNPATDYIHIISPPNVKFTSFSIFDYLGRKMKSIQSNNTSEQVFYIGDLYPGVFVLLLENEIKNKVVKFIKI